MALLNILTEGDEALRKHCRPVDSVTDRIRRLLDDMYETMLKAEGVGLAGPQVGVLRRVVVIEVPESGRIDLVNPEILHTEGSQVGREGCLSIPDQSGIVERPMTVTVRALDRNGEPFELTGNELLARALCHEIDHLDGILYTDKAQKMITDEDEEEE